jgi:polysaccharide biosynthesis protein PslH
MKNILFVSPILPFPGAAGNTVRVATMTRALKTLGHNLTFVYSSFQDGDRDKALLEEWGDNYIETTYKYPKPPIPYRIARKLRLRALLEKLKDERFKNRPIDYWYDHQIDSILCDLQKRNHYDVVIAEYVIWSRCFEQFNGNVRKIVDTHDALSNRYKVFQQAKVPPPFWPWGSVSLSPADEGKGLDRSDIVITISDDDRANFRAVTSRPIVTVGHVLPTITPPLENGVRNKLLFVGSTWSANVDGVTRFIHEILPKVRREIPDVILLVAGSICWILPDDLDCTKLGVLKDLGEAYATADMAINPVEWGSGMCIKSIEAMGHSLPLISYASGARGLQDAVGQAIVAVQSDDEFASAIVSLFRNPQALARKRKEAYSFASEWNKKQINSLNDAVSG